MSSKPPVPKTKFTRSFKGGANLSTQREAIDDDELWWVEGLMPVADGELTILNGPVVATGDGLNWHTTINGESGAPSFMCTFNVAGTDYIFVVWSNSGNGYIGDIGGFTVTKVFAATLTSGTTSAAQWNNQGLLIIDPTGYWDWNVTTAATLTAISQSVQQIDIVDGGVYTTFPAAITITGGGGAGAVGSAFQGIGSAIPSTPGSGYKVGDVLTFRFTLGVAAGGSEPQLTVTTVNATGGATGLKVTDPGEGVNIGGACPASNALTGGAGTGCVASLAWTITRVDVVTRGSGYSTAPVVGFTGGVATRAGILTATVSGSLGGTSIATYAGRAWIANGRTVIFTDAGTYASFVGSGSEFTINDSYLHNNITALYAANSYLYIFGVDSIDVLSNVTITSAGTASFSRVNVSASNGSDQPNSIFAYNRAVAFANSTGFYLMSGSSPEPISDKLNLLMPYISFTPGKVYGAQGTPRAVGLSTSPGNMVAMWSVSLIDAFFSGGASVSMLLAYYKGKWFLSRQASTGAPLSFGPIVSIPPALNVSQAFEFFTIDATRHLYEMFSSTLESYWRVCTKLYDCGTPMWTKQAIRAAIGAEFGGAVSTRAGLTVTVDTEFNAAGTGPATPLLSGTLTGYKALMGSNSAGGGQFMGITATGVGVTQADVLRLQWLAFQYQEVTEWAA